MISIIGKWFRSYLDIFNKGIGKSIESAMKEKHKLKLSKVNFTDQEVPKEVLELIEKGIKGVPNLKYDGVYCIKKAKGKILDNLKTVTAYRVGM